MSGLDCVSLASASVASVSVASVSGAPPSPGSCDFSLASLTVPVGARASLYRAGAIVQCHTVSEMERFISCRDSLPNHLRGFIVPYDLEKYIAKRAQLFLTLDGQGGVALINGELGSLFSLPGARYGDMLVEFAIKQGAYKLSCFDTGGKLPSFYHRHGFTETSRAPWNDAYAPKTWDYSVWGRPDYVEMTR